MKCELDYCIYNGEGTCVIENISINGLGMCDECTIVSLKKDFLQAEKLKQLQEINSRWNNEGK